MCGIAGLVDLDSPPDERVLRAMEQALLHRGPDEGAVWRAGCAGLVHRRLCIIDLSPAAAQPMANEDGRIRVVFNGEIYNHHALRKELLALGHVFRSRSDTEVLLHGYESWGTEFIGRLRGMFAFALWDEGTGRLLLARDRFGKKPLFYNVTGRRLAFASELDAFKALPASAWRLSLPAFRDYVEYGYVPGTQSILKDIHRLPAGHFAVWEKGSLSVKRYWALPTEPGADRHRGGADEAASALEESLRDAVTCRLESDVPLGCFLSGGVDSSLVAALAQEALGGKLKTYTVGFDNAPQSEAEHARAVARHLGTDHHELSVSSESVLRDMEPILRAAAEPLGDDSYVPMYLISRETRRFVTVAISGDGGDELFAGYEKYRQFFKARPLMNLPLPWRLLAHLAPNDRWHKSAAALATGDSLGLARWLSSLWKRDEIPSLLTPAALSAPAGPDIFAQSWQLRPQFPDIERWMLADMETYLEGDILTKVDRASMAASLEGRSPFLDGCFAEAVFRWACRAELPHGGKTILKTMLARRLPREIFERPKQGFGMPVEQWFRGPLRDLLLRQTDEARVRSRGLLNPSLVTETVRQHLSGRRNYARKLYALVAFELWADRFFGPGVALA